MLKKRKKYYVTFNDEVNNLIEGDSGIGNGEFTELQAQKEAIDYLGSEWGMKLSGVIATFHDINMYEQELYDEAEIDTVLYNR